MSLIKRFIQKLRQREEGAVLVELALSIPLFITLLMGSVEMGNYLLLHMKMQHTVVSIADLVTRDEKISEDVLDDIFLAVPQIMAPYDTSANSLMVVSAISQTEDDPAAVYWQRASGSLQNIDSQVGLEGGAPTLPSTLTLRDDETILVTEIFYHYKPLVFAFIPESTLSRIAYFRPRIGALQSIE